MSSFRLAVSVAPAAALTALLVAGACASTGPRTETPVAQAARPSDDARELAAAMRDELGIPGLAVAVGDADGIVWSEGFGLASLELGTPATPRQRFRLASVSKLVTAAIAARLVDQGRLDLDAPAPTFLADLPESWATVTPRQILGHLSGIRHYQPKDYVDDWDSKHFDTVVASLAAFRDDPLLYPPGQQEHYSTYSFTLLAAILEAAGGATFEELVEREVARPLGLSTLGLDRRDRIVDGRVGFYDRTGSPASGAGAAPPGVRNSAYLDPSYKWAGGGMVMSAEDLVRFGQAHLAPGYLTASTHGAMFTPQKRADGEPIGTGLAWRIGVDDAGRPIRHHSGSQEGSRAFLLLYPEQRLVLAFLSNLGGIPSDPLKRAQALAAPFLAQRTN